LLGHQVASALNCRLLAVSASIGGFVASWIDGWFQLRTVLQLQVSTLSDR
jgi:hypothetical protein